MPGWRMVMPGAWWCVQVAATPEAWAARIQELLVTLHAVLDVVMVGLEDGKLVATCRSTPFFLSHCQDILAPPQFCVRTVS